MLHSYLALSGWGEGEAREEMSSMGPEWIMGVHQGGIGSARPAESGLVRITA